MHRSLITRCLTAATLLAVCIGMGGCASLLPIAGAIVLKEAADRYEKSEARPARGTASTTGVRAEGVQAGDSPDLKAPQGSAAAKVASVPTSVGGAEESATESTARILATAIKRVPTPSAEPVNSTKPVRN
ncbi:MAG TPA: hypothetical protein VF777_03920 [Phycisphaerales bacterium]